MKKKIFGKIYKFSCSRVFEELLHQAIALYPDDSESDVDVAVNITDKPLSSENLSTNPGIHTKTTSGMLTIFGKNHVHWSRAEKSKQKLQVDVHYHKTNLLRKQMRQVLSIEYANDAEIFEQFLHELILVPSVFFFNDLALIHAASLSIGDKCYLLAGTGGTGKTSSLLSLKDNNEVSFISDDISVVSPTGEIFGNMAWPKIYGYNCTGNTIKQQIFRDRSLFDKACFNLRNWLNPSRVRRKIKPDMLYGAVKSGKQRITDVFYLVRRNINSIRQTPLELEKAVEMSIKVINTEYTIFINHIYWAEYNALATKSSSLLSVAEVTKNWRQILKSCFQSVKLTQIEIPLKIEHTAYIEQIREILLGGRSSE